MDYDYFICKKNIFYKILTNTLFFFNFFISLCFVCFDEKNDSISSIQKNKIEEKKLIKGKKKLYPAAHAKLNKRSQNMI